MAATLARRHVHEAFVEASGFSHGHTYVGHASACAAGLAVMQVIENEGLLDHVVSLGEYLQRALETAFADRPYVGDIRGRGLFRALEFVADKHSKAPFPDAMTVTGRLKQASMKHGLICYPGGGSERDNLGSHILLAPPFVAQEHHIHELIEKLDAVFGDVFDG